jgi:hypothetical protein
MAEQPMDKRRVRTHRTAHGFSDPDDIGSHPSTPQQCLSFGHGHRANALPLSGRRSGVRE